MFTRDFFLLNLQPTGAIFTHILSPKVGLRKAADAS